MRNRKQFTFLGITKGATMYYLVLGMLFFSSCSWEFHMKKAMKKNPSAFDTVRVERVDTIQLPPLEKIITEIKLVPGNDTTIVRDRHGQQITIIRRGDLAEIIGESPAPKMVVKTIEQTVHIKVPPTGKEKWKIWWRKTRWMLLVALGLIIGWKFRKQIFSLAAIGIPKF